ncbi:MAG: DinB family protein [Acidobacteria bacterium]|nr:DinB family protein [Acidobacteriota bacterium]MBV8891228.1 DinB family protein [Acidobacteriota bacterium]MBV9482500.1 DinB family protein [Acidobacteriota bacterium]
MSINPDQALREHLVGLLRGGNAHTAFDGAISGLPAEARGKKIRGLPHTAWMILEHLRIAQWDIVEFSRNPQHTSPRWPEGYWPQQTAPSSDSAWNKSERAFREDLETMEALVSARETDLYAPIPWGKGQTILREALLVADHNAYHIGELVVLRRLLGAWPAQ